MNTKTATKIATGLLYAAVLSVPVGMIATPAQAHAETRVPAPVVTVHKTVKAKSSTPRWSKHDKKVMRAANKTCAAITDDVTYEMCVVGAFHLGDADSKTRRVITDRDYTYADSGEIVLVQTNGKVA